MRLFASVLIATMMALFMAIVVAYQAINYEYVTIYHLTMFFFFAAMFGFGVMWCLARFQDLQVHFLYQQKEKQSMARRVE
jgi:hypothetical protein